LRLARLHRSADHQRPLTAPEVAEQPAAAAEPLFAEQVLELTGIVRALHPAFGRADRAIDHVGRPTRGAPVEPLPERRA